MEKWTKRAGVAVMSLPLLIGLNACKKSDTPAHIEPAGPERVTTSPPPQESVAALPEPLEEGEAKEDVDTAESSPIELTDIIVYESNHLIGISYPEGVDKYPGMAKVLHDYAESARLEVVTAVEALGDEALDAPYELSLNFDLLEDTPQLMVVAAEGSQYTGQRQGAQPLLARFVWLPSTQKLLTVEELIDSDRGWDTLSMYIAERMYTTVHTRLEDEALSPTEQQQLLRSANRAIAMETEAKAENFRRFEPMLDEDGQIVAIRFVFPPYQAGPYADGVQAIEVPASILLPHVAEDYRMLFVQ